MVYVYFFLYIIQIELYSTLLCIASFTQYYVCKIYLCVARSCSFKECRVMRHLPKRGVSHKLFEVVLHGRFICSLPFIYLIISLYQHGLVDLSFIMWFIISYYSLFCSHYSSFGHWKLFQLAPVSLWYMPITVFLVLCFRQIPSMRLARWKIHFQGSEYVLQNAKLFSGILSWSTLPPAMWETPLSPTLIRIE